MKIRQFAIVACVLALAACHPDAAPTPSPALTAQLHDGARGTELTPQQSLRAAVVQGNISQATQALEDGADVNEAVYGTAPLHIAAANGDVAMAHLLTTHGAILDARDAALDSALHIAAREDDVAMVKELVADGADVEARRGYWSTTPLALAALAGSTNAMEALVDAGAPVDQDSTGKGDTALLLASCWGTLSSVMWLADHGAAISVNDNHGYSAISCAVVNGSSDVVTYLRSNGVVEE